MKEQLDKAQIPSIFINRENVDFDNNGIKLFTMHSIKGLEFKVVIIIGLNNNIIPYCLNNDSNYNKDMESMERKLLYVGMTRANEILYLTSHGSPSKFIKEIQPTYVRLTYASKIRKYYDIQLDNYEFKDTVDLYSNEEKIRQWVIAELRSTYKYPLDLIGVEYKINNFSRPGFIDVVVFVYRNNKRIPFIFIETKPFGKGITDGLDQMISYLSNYSSCRYGLVTDGNEFAVINNKFEQVEDIPVFHSSMLPSSMENFTYIDLRNRRNLEFTRDVNVPEEIIIKDDEGQSSFIKDNLIKFPVYGSIAAGQPLHMNRELEQQFFLPNQWLQNQENHFILEIRGDSMQGANIENGDYVIIKQQRTADNMDIVAVALEEEATLKTYRRMGNNVLLIPENENYEPIQIKSDHANIMGIAVGIIKRQDYINMENIGTS